MSFIHMILKTTQYKNKNLFDNSTLNNNKKYLSILSQNNFTLTVLMTTKRTNTYTVTLLYLLAKFKAYYTLVHGSN